MFSKKTATAVALLSVLVLLLVVAAQCGAPATPQTVVETVVVEKAGETVVETVVVEKTVEVEKMVEVTPTPVPAEERVTLDLVVGTEPPSLDPSLATDSTSIWTIRQMFMGLTGFDERASVIPSLATEWSASEDGLTWTYKMRDDVHWIHRNPTTGEFEDLGPVTAQDVEYGVKRTLDPTTASDYAYVLYIIQGAEEFNTADPAAENIGELRDAVGVKAVDDTTVEFTLKEPAGYFPSISAMWVTFPLPQDAIETYGDNWTEAGLIVTNGPYTLEEWSHGAYLRLVKNPLWVDADTVQIEVIQGPIIQEASTQMAMYEANEVDMMADPGWGPPLPDMDRIKADPQLSQELLIAPRLCTYYYGFVNSKPPFDDVTVRKAFAAAIDRQSLIDNVLKGDQLPAHSFAPPGIFGNVADDMSVGSWMVMDSYADQVKQAQDWLAEAGYPEGEGIDATLMHNTSEAHAQIAQAVQAMWAEAFPKANISIENQEWSVYLKTLLPDSPDEDKPDIYRLGWCADYPDENNWVNEVFNSKSGQNYAKYFNPDFDALVEQAANEADPEIRKDLYKQAETMFMDDQGIAPIYYYTYVRLYKPWLTKVVISPVTGDPIAEWQIDWAAKTAARGQ
jgi:oligopeptide transport system substrate-binding protein